jgi:proton-dependent oligopeptide transporter, POT family
MSTAPNLEVVEAAKADYPAIEKGIVADKPAAFKGDVAASDSEVDLDVLVGPNGEQYPTKDEIASLRRVCGKIPWMIYTIGFIELCERFAYYGTTAVFVNFISYPLPENSAAGAGYAGGNDNQSGALGLGQQASTGLTLFNSFWSFLMPVLGGYLADSFWGRFRTIHYAIWIAMVGHIIIIVAAIPSVIQNPNGAIAAFAIGLIFFGVGVGFFKCNVSPLVAEQYERHHPRQYVQTLASGERVIVDPVMTLSRIYMRFYLMINIGALIGQLTMVFAEHYVGFWLSFTLPTIMFLFCPLVMFVCNKRYVKRPPTESVLGKTFALLGLALKDAWSINPARFVRNVNAPDFWEKVKPSNVTNKPKWMTFDDAWVDEVRRGLKACAVFCFFPIYWLAYGQQSNNMVNQAATLETAGVPNDVINNLNPLALIIFIPIVDKFVYPGLARMGIRFTPIKKIAMGFLMGTLAMTIAAIIQHFIYARSPCGTNASDLSTGGCVSELGRPSISVWVQTPSYIAVAFSEIFASITALEYAFTKAPKNMRGIVVGLFFFANAFSSALAQAFVPLATDPLLIWLYTVVAVISAAGGLGFWWCFHRLDKEEDALNALPESTYQGRGEGTVDVEALAAQQAEQEKLRKAQGLA